MDPSGFNPAFPFPVPTTTTANTDLNLHSHPLNPSPFIPDLHLSQIPHPDSQTMKEANVEVNDQPAATNSAQRKRGRPRKVKPTTEPNFEPVTVEPVSHDNGVTVEENVDVAPEKRAARAVKRFGSEAFRNVVRKSKKDVLRGPLGYPKRGRGRPPKSKNVSTVTVAGVRMRGRPKSLGVGIKKAVVQKTIGWHTNNVGSRILGPADPQWMVDYAHVRAKIDHVQSRMRDAIGVIKPHLMNQIMTNGNIGTALQELDQLSTMDVMAVSLGGTVEQPEAVAGAQVY